MKNIISLVSRILLAQIFLISGFGKLGAGYAPTGAYMAAHHVPTVLLPLVIALELGGGLALVLGFQTRFFATFLAVFCIIAALIFHDDLANMIQKIMFMKNFAISGGLLLLTANGAGDYSLDALRTGALSTKGVR
ncbi:MAG: DoxX family protein [Syntrophobacteraceae bacterium]